MGRGRPKKENRAEVTSIRYAATMTELEAAILQRLVAAKNLEAGVRVYTAAGVIRTLVMEEARRRGWLAERSIDEVVKPTEGKTAFERVLTGASDPENFREAEKGKPKKRDK